MRITLRQIQVFAAIARIENVSRAAESLAMSQSAASNSLVELERQFNCPLFDRIGKSLRLNSTGRGLLPQAEEMLARAADIEGYLNGGTFGPINIGATLTIGNYLATLVIAKYLQQHPQSKAQLHVANTEKIIEQLIHHEIDLGLIEGEVNHPDLFIEPWLDDALVVFCAPSHPFSNNSDIKDLSELAQQDWIVREHGSGTRALFDHVIGQAIPNLKIRLALEHTEAIKRAVESGLGIGCLSRLSLREAFRRGSLIEIPTPQFNLNRQFYFARHRQRYLSPAAEYFLALCREASGTARGTDTIRLPFIG